MMISQSQTILLNAIRSSLFSNDFNPPVDTDWEDLELEAKAQTVTGLIDGIVPIQSISSAQISALFLQLIFEQTELVKLLDDAGIPYVILKGTAAAMYYPKPYLRTMGDVDFLVKHNRYEETKKMMILNGYELIHENERHAGFEKNGIEFELHHHFSSPGYDIDSILEAAIDRRENVELCGYRFHVLPSAENGLVLLGHINQHLKENGLGLRQIIDWEMYINRVSEDADWHTVFINLADDAGLLRLAAYVTEMCKKYLGLQNNVDWGIEIEESLEDELLEVVMTDGNFNRRADLTDSKAAKSLRSASYNIVTRGWFSYFQGIGLEYWILCKKIPALSPFAFIYGFFRQMNKGVIAIIKNKSVGEQIKDGKKRKELYSKLGVKSEDK